MDTTARILQQSIQTRANLMHRRAQRNLMQAALDSASAANSQALVPAAGASSSGGRAAADHGLAGALAAPRGPLPPGPLPPSPLPPGPLPPGPLPQRVAHMTNFELERLFALTTAPATAAAMRFGGAPGAAAANRLRDALAAQRQNSSEGYLRSWDAHDSSDVVTVRPEPEPPQQEQQHSDAQRARRADAALASLPAQQLAAPVEGDPCAICQEFMCAGEAVRRLPCAHLFHADCIATWLPVRLTCPLDNLPVDEGLEMLAGAAGTAPAPLGAGGSSRAPLPPPSEPPPPLPPLPPGFPPGGPPSLPPLGLRELQAVATGAGVTPERLADALAQRRSVQAQLHELSRERGGAPIILE